MRCMLKESAVPKTLNPARPETVNSSDKEPLSRALPGYEVYMVSTHGIFHYCEWCLLGPHFAKRRLGLRPLAALQEDWLHVLLAWSEAFSPVLAHKTVESRQIRRPRERHTAQLRTLP